MAPVELRSIQLRLAVEVLIILEIPPFMDREGTLQLTREVTHKTAYQVELVVLKVLP
jgi:hypothetical protein